jgi:signal transduction histidine kinase/ligand-binding sensor domain-containing protein
MFSIAQTSDGFLWFLSLPGDIYRYDGVRFLLWRTPADFSSSTIGKIFADHAGGLWVIADELNHLKDGVVTSHFALQGLHGFQSVIGDPDGSLWVGRRASDAPLCHISDHGVKCFGKEAGIPISDLQSVLADGSGGFWLGGPTGGLVHWHAGVSEVYPVKAGIMSLARAPDGTLWVGIQAEGPGLGLAELKDGDVKPFVTPTFDGSKLSVTSLMFDRDGNLWVGSDAKGLFRIHGNDVEHYGHTGGLSGDSVWALFEDREGIIWVGTTSGIDSFRDPRVVTFSALEGLGKDLAAGILASRDGSIWVANNGSLDRIKNGTVSSIRRTAGLPGDQVAAMLEDRAGNIWVGVDDGLYLFKDGHFRRLPEPNHQPLGMVVGMAEDIDGNIWAECASNPRKLVRIRDFQVREVFSASQVLPGHNLTADPHGGIWIETLKGDVALFRSGNLETTISLNKGGSPLNRQIIAHADGSVLVGTENGLVGWRAGKVQRMTTKNGLPCDFIISFIEDKEKRWWLYTRCGVVEFSDSELQRWWANPDAIVQYRFYDTFDGAQPNIGSFNASAYSPDGRVWFSSGVVVQMVDPSRLSATSLPALTYIESVTVDRKGFAAPAHLTFAPHPRDLQINYTSPVFRIPQKVRFRYRLDGYDRDWHEAGTRRQAFYTDLPPGNYSFRVIASNSDGIWNDSTAQLDFSVAPAYYQTAWFRALCVAAFLALLWALYQVRLRQLARQFNLRLEERVGERTRIARDLHDTLLQSFHGILLQFQTGINMLPERPGEARKALEKAMHQAKHAIVEGREAIQGLRSSVAEPNDLALAMRTLGEELAAKSNAVAFQVHVEGTPRDLHPILRDEVYRVAGEAMRNAFRHADAHRIEVEIRYHERQLRVRVRDDGKGIDPKLITDDGREGHFGLRGMRERANLIGGKLTVWSERDAGTEVELSIPATNAFTAPTGGKQMGVAEKFLAMLSGRHTVKKP